MLHDEARAATPRTLRRGAALLRPTTARAAVLFVRVLRAKAAGTGKSWWRTPLFARTVLPAGLAIVPGLALGATARTQAALGVRVDPLPTSMAVLAILLLLPVATSILAIGTVLRRGGDLLHGSPEMIGLDGWCRSRLGVWWVGRVGLWAVIAAVEILFGNPTGFVVLFYFLGLAAAVDVAHAWDMYFPTLAGTRERARTAYLRMQACRASPAFRQLERRNRWIEMGTIPVVLSALGAPFLVGRHLQLYDRYDPRVLLLMALTVGLVVTAPAGFIRFATLAHGRSGLAEFQDYWTMKHDDQLKVTRATLRFFTLLTIVSAIAVAMTADFSHV